MFLIHSNEVKMLKVKWGCAEKFLLCWRRVVVAVVCVAGCSRSSPVSPARSSPWSRWAAVHLHHICSSSPSLARSLQTPAGFTQNVHDRSVTQSITGTDKFLLHSLSYVPHVTQRRPERHRCCLPESLVQAAKNSTISNDSYPVKHFAMSLIMWDVSVWAIV